MGAGMLGGMGFTMSLFISGRSFVDAQLHQKTHEFGLSVLLGSNISASAGLILLSISVYRDSCVYKEA